MFTTAPKHNGIANITHTHTGNVMVINPSYDSISIMAYLLRLREGLAVSV